MATFRLHAVGGSTTGTSDRTAAAITPVVGDLFVVFAVVAANANDTPTCSDDNGGSYDRIFTLPIVITAVNYRVSAFIRTAFLANTTSTTATVATGSNTSGAVHLFAVAGMLRKGANAVRNFGTQSDQAAATPAPVMGNPAITGNMMVGVVGNGTNPATMTPPTSWTEPVTTDTGFANDTVGLESCYRNSGHTSATVTWGSASGSRFAAGVIELNSDIIRVPRLAMARPVTPL